MGYVLPHRRLVPRLRLHQQTSRHLKGDRKQFWQTRYYDRNIRGEDARAEVIHYIHQNPVKRGLVSRPEDYPWCSVNHYLTGERGPIEIESHHTARLRDHSHSPP